MPPSGRSRAAQMCRPYGLNEPLLYRDRSPHPPRFARHLPLKGKACGRPQGSPLHKKQTGSVGSAMPGAAVEPHQHQFWECQGPVARREYRLPLRFCAPKLLQYFQVRVPRNGGPGVSGPMDLGGAKRSRSPSVASPGDPLVTFPSCRFTMQVQQ